MTEMKLLTAPPSPLLLPAWAGSGKRVVAAERHIAHVPTALRRPRVLVACERSGIVRDAFLARGFDAWSCDLVPSDRPGPHIINDVRNVLDDGWDLMIAHPPCTHLARSGCKHWPYKQAVQKAAIEFVDVLWNAPIPMIAIENPLGILSWKRPILQYQGDGFVWRKYDDLIHPWMFGHGETKQTCLWLKNLPPLMRTLISSGRDSRIHDMGPSTDRAEKRSVTYLGIAGAMAQQWSRLLSVASS